MPYEFYKILHITGLILVFSGLVSVLTMSMTRVEITGHMKKFAFISHGVGLVLMLISGFGLMARLGMVTSMPTWIYFKLAIWVILGGMIALAKRKGYIGWPIFILFVGLGATAATLAITKPWL